MINASLGDMAVSYAQRQRNTLLKQDINRLTTELASGQISDTGQLLAGNTGYLSDIESKMSALAGYKIATTESTHYASAMQTSLEQIAEISQGLSASLLATGIAITGASGAETAGEARHALSDIIGRLNGQIAGRYLFSGTATDTPPVADVDTILTGLRTALTGATSPDEIVATTSAWFNDPAGFAATAYQGSPDALSPFALSESENVTLDIKATAPELLQLMAMTAVAAVAADTGFALNKADQTELFDRTGQEMLGAQENLISLQARVGFAEARIDAISARNSAELTGFEYAKSALLAVDPFEAATKLEEAQFQLQSLYSVTVRMSQLSIVNFL